MNTPMLPLAIRTLGPADLDAADGLLQAAYGMRSRRAELARNLALQPDGWVLAYLEDRLVGIAGATLYGPTAYIGLVGTDPAYQRRGIAMALMRHLLGWLRERGGPIVLLDASLKGAPLYERLSFVDDEQSVVYTLSEDAPRPPFEERFGLADADKRRRARIINTRSAFVRVRPRPNTRGLKGSRLQYMNQVVPMRASDLPDVTAFDAPIFGAARPQVHACLLAELPARAFVARDAQGRLCGYLFAQPTNIGPWAAHSPTEAAALLGAALALAYEPGAGPTVLAPSSNPAVAELLLRHGFSPQRALRHMRLGGNGPVGDRARLYGLASFAIG